MRLNSTLSHRAKSIEKNIAKRQILRQSIEKSFLIVPLTINNVIYRDSLTLIKMILVCYQKQILMARFKASNFAVDYRIFQKDRNKNGGGLILYVTESIPGKLINIYNFKEVYENISFQFSISNKKWFLL